ncbi:MAG TPA: hypothetical protein VFP72_00295 [Kineosporiaceae bacterium]|nr:hypothetical protein [Kineosporiaceae bacterium]
MLARRGPAGATSGSVVFPSPLGQTRDRSNTTGDLRRAFDRAGVSWVSSHTLRKTVATRLDDAGLSARPSLTQDVYLSRKVAGPAAARVLEM